MPTKMNGHDVLTIKTPEEWFEVMGTPAPVWFTGAPARFELSVVPHLVPKNTPGSPQLWFAKPRPTCRKCGKRYDTNADCDIHKPEVLDPRACTIAVETAYYARLEAARHFKLMPEDVEVKRIFEQLEDAEQS